MLAMDNDDVVPSGLSNDQLMPYLKNQDLLNGFNYTFEGGSLSGISNPTDTEMGYVIGPGGRAIVYADGHAQWKPD
jgi:prepilin-type processing-associated H-X9-DG protein